MSRSVQPRLVFATCAIVLLSSVATQAAEVQTTLSSIPSWSMGDGHLKPRTLSVSTKTVKTPPHLLTAKHPQVTLREPVNGARIR